MIQTDLYGNGEECQFQIEVMNLFINIDFTDGNFTAETAGNLSDYVPELIDLPLLQQEGCVAVIGAINENEHPNPLKLTPNPANESFKLEIEKIKSDDFKQLEIRDLSGRIIFQTNDQNCLKEGIHTSQFLPGVYQLVLLMKENRFSSRLSIVH